MTIFFHEYEASRQRRELEALDRKLEHWGWYRRHEGKSLPAGWRLRVGKLLIALGCWVQGRGHAEAIGASGKS